MVEYKVSDTGWLCVRGKRGEWMPVVKLTEQQLEELRMVKFINEYASKQNAC